MQRFICISSILFVASIACAQELPSWVHRVDVSFHGAAGIGAVTLSGEWLDTCIPDTVSHQQEGNLVQLEVTFPGINVGCGDAITPWSLTEEFGPLSSPYFAINGALVAVDPSNRNTREIISGPDLLYRRHRPQARFQGIGAIGQDAYVSEAFDVSSNGRVVVGHNEVAPGNAAFITSEAFAWTPSTGMFPLGILPGGIPGGSSALGTAGDGNQVVGQSTSANLGGLSAFSWTLGGGMHAIPNVMEPAISDAVAASWNGSVIVGREEFYGPAPGGVTQTNAYRWTRQAGNQYLGQLHVGGNAWATDVSADGTRVVGSATVDPLIEGVPEIAYPDISEPFLWTADTGMVGLGHLPTPLLDLIWPSQRETTAEAISSDGKFVVGTSKVLAGSDTLNLVSHRGYIWSRETGMRDLGDIPGWSTTGIDVVDVSGDGRVVVGMAQVRAVPEPGVADGSSAPTFYAPFLWQRGQGMSLLSDVLEELSVQGFDGWGLGQVSAISDDGTTIVGTGRNPNGVQEAWRLVFDWPAFSVAATLGDLNGDGAIDAADASLLFSQWGKSGELLADLNGDRTVDAADAGIMFSNWNSDAGLEADLAARQAPAPQSVPEPSGWIPLSLAYISMLACMRVRRRRRRDIPG